MAYLPGGRPKLSKLGADRNWAELGAQCDAGRDLNAAAEFLYGMSPLHWAARYDAPADLVRRMVVAHKADLGWLNEDGWTALHIAALKGHANLVRLLAELGAPVDAQSTAKAGSYPAGSTALHVAAHKGTDATTALIEGGADAALRDAGGKTAREVAEVKGEDKIAALIGDPELVARGQAARIHTKMAHEFARKKAHFIIGPLGPAR